MVGEIEKTKQLRHFDVHDCLKVKQLGTFAEKTRRFACRKVSLEGPSSMLVFANPPALLSLLV